MTNEPHTLLVSSIHDRRCTLGIVQYGRHCNELMEENMEREWAMVCKRTDDPKLAWIENRLDALGIEHRRGIPSFHANATLEVPAEQETAFWEFMMQPAPSKYRRWYKTLDDMPDDHAIFQYPDEVYLIGDR